MKKLSPEMERALLLLRKSGVWHYAHHGLLPKITLDSLVRRGMVERRYGPIEMEYRAKGD